jgi:hypothetical protein
MQARLHRFVSSISIPGGVLVMMSGLAAISFW